MARAGLVAVLALAVVAESAAQSKPAALDVEAADIVPPTKPSTKQTSDKASDKPSGKTSTKKSSAKTSRASAAKARAKKRKRRARPKPNLPPGWAWPPTKRMKQQGETCKKTLTELGVDWKKGRREGRIVTPVQVPSLVIGGFEYHSRFRRPPFNIDCHLVWALAESGPQLLAMGAHSAVFSSFFRNTKVRVYGTTKNAMSRHSFGLAVDLYSVTDAEEKTAVVETDYPAGNDLLYELEDGLNKSGLFRTVLTPANDPASHHDHFHIEVDVRALHDAKQRARNIAQRAPAEPDPDGAEPGAAEPPPPTK